MLALEVLAAAAGEVVYAVHAAAVVEASERDLNKLGPFVCVCISVPYFGCGGRRQSSYLYWHLSPW